MPGFDDAGTAFDAAISFDSAGSGGGGGGTFTVEGWGGISLSIEVAFTVQDFIIGTGIIGTTHLGPIPTWTDITEHVQDFNCKRGRQRALERFSTGTFSASLINTDGRFDPTNLTGPYVSGGETQVVPGCPVRVRIEYGGTTYPVWRGYADSWPGTWAKGPADSAAAFASLEASGVFEWPAGVELLEGPAQGAGELAGARIDRILASVNWPTFLRDLDTGVAAMQDTNLEGQVVDQLQTVADSEGGFVFEGSEGSVVFRDRQSPYTHPESLTSQATFGDDLVAIEAGTELPYSDVTFNYSLDLVKNDVDLSREDSDTHVTLKDGVSRRKYGPKTYNLSNLQNADDGSLAPLAVSIINQSADAELRFDSLTIRPRRAPEDLWPVILGLDLRHRVTVYRRPASGNVIGQACFIESISHSGPRQGEWETKFELSAAEAFSDSPFIIGASLLGGADVLVP